MKPTTHSNNHDKQGKLKPALVRISDCPSWL